MPHNSWQPGWGCISDCETLLIWTRVSFSLCVLWDDLPRHFISKIKSRTLLFTSVAAAPLCFVITTSIIFSPSFFRFLLFPPRSFLICLVPLLISPCRFPSALARIILHFLTLFACILESPPLCAAGYVGHVAGRSSLISPAFFSLRGTYESRCNKSEERCNDFECFTSRFIKHETLGFVCVCVCLPASKIHA